MGNNPDILVAMPLVALLLGIETALHEVVHALINFAATGKLATAGELGPFTVYSGRIATYHAPGGIGAWNDLLTPVCMSVLGLLAVYYSDWVEWRPGRWSIAFAGVYTWAVEALYSMGIWAPPMLSDGQVTHFSDGINALEAFGPWAQLPGVFLLGFGIWVVLARVQYQRRSV